MTTQGRSRLTKRDLEAINSALAEKLAGIIEHDDTPREHYEAAQDKVQKLLAAQRATAEAMRGPA